MQALKYFLSRFEKEMFSDDISESAQSNLSTEQWKALKGLAADKTIVLKRAIRAPQDNCKIRTNASMLNSMKTYSPIWLQKAIRYLKVCVIIN